MTDKLREQLSALADDELPSVERRLLLRRLSADPALREEWERIHLIRDGLHNELPREPGAGLAQRVMDALDDEPKPSRGVGRVARQLVKPLTGLAVAASVAALALIGLERVTGPEPELGRAAPHIAALDQPLEDQVVGTSWDRPAMGTRLNAYLVNHSEYTGSSLQGSMNYVRIAGYDNDY